MSDPANEVPVPHEAVAVYLGSKATPNLYEVRALLALPPVDRMAWGQRIVQEFDQQLPALPAPAAANATVNPDPATLDDLGPMRNEAQAYLAEVSQGYPNVGTWRWTLTDVPSIVPVTEPAPKVVSMTPPLENPIEPAKATIRHGESFVEVVADDWHTLCQKVAAFFRSVGHDL